MPDVGDNLGRYTLLRRLAAGGMGEVYVAAKPGPVGFGPYVALKVLRDELAVDQQFVDMLVDEANISMFLNHQNVVAVLDLAEDSGRYYIAMEFVQGITVERLVDSRAQSNKKPDIPAGLYIATELCRALKYAHTRVNHTGEPLNIVHRDVTPANILLSTQGEVKLTDFGIARAKGRVHQTQAGVLKGKFGYMAPEMVRYERIDARADIFCAGVCVYLMITGRHPVAGAAVMEAIQMYEEGRIPPPKQFNADISDSLSNIVMKALQPKVENRWASAAAFGDALQDVTLQNPAWRRGVQDGARLVREMIKDVAPDTFKEPVERKVLDDLLAKLRKKDVSKPAFLPKASPKREEARRAAGSSDEVSSSQQITITPTGGRPTTGIEDTADVDADTADRLPAISPDMDFDPTPSAIDPDFETDESAPAPRNGVTFPESSTDRHRIRESMMDEPALPAGASEDTGGSDRTVAGYDFGADGTESAPRVEDPDDDMADGATATGVDDEEDFGAPTLAMSAVSVEEEPLPPGIDVSDPMHDDSKTLAGVALAEKWTVDGSVDVSLPTVEGADEDFDAATIVPEAMRAGDDWEGGATEADGHMSQDATLLDGISADDVQAAVTARKAVPKSASLVRDESADDLPAVRLDPSYDELIREGTGEIRPKDPAADPADRPSERSDPKLFSGPLRIVVGNDGPAIAKSEPNKEKEAKSAADALAAAVSSPGGFKPAAEKRRAAPAPEPKKNLGAAVPQPASNLDVGQETGKWMAGKLDGGSLDWSDDAAARRAVAVRNQPAPAPQPAQPPVAHHGHAPQPQLAPPQQPYQQPYQQPHQQPHLQFAPPPSFVRRNWMVVSTLGVAIALFGTLIYLWALTSTFWPKLKLDSSPQGAVVTIDGSLVAGQTPLTVRVEPEKRHLVEFSMHNKKRVLREITEDVGRGRTYSLTVELEAQPPRFEIIGGMEGTLYINDAEAGHGKQFILTDLPAKGAIHIRIEAAGYNPYDRTFSSAADVPPEMDIPLNRIQ